MNGNNQELRQNAPFHHPKLPTPPSSIEDKFSSVIGDGFHFMDRTKVPTNHCWKKSFYAALQEAFFSWNPEMLLNIKNKMKLKYNLTDEELDADMHFKVRWWQQRAFRKILPPSILYWRVRAVIICYGSKIDTESNKPLFNERAWKKSK